jgi:protein CpxP
MTRIRNSFTAAAMFAGVAALGLAPAFAQTAPDAPAAAPAQQGAARAPGHHWLTPGQLVEGRIAFLKTELKITPAQEGAWQQFAAAMRENAQSLDQAISTARAHHGTAQNAVERMEMRAQFAKLRADNEARLVTAFKPLYASLTPQQQQLANQLMSMQARWHHGWHHRA